MLLCLDLASVTGFAVGDEAGVQAHGSFQLPKSGSDYGLFLSGLAGWLTEAVARWKPDSICYESPILPGVTTIATLRKLYSMGPRVEEFARDHRIECSEANLTNIRQHFVGWSTPPRTVRCEADCKRKRCGHCRAVRKKWLKEAIEVECRRRGFKPADDNDSDALALFSFAMSNRIPGFVMAGNEIARAA